mmetsp:Transcript_16495/g.34041  ORF Transcript_16495/g.34041 Transcript_16495/m.34041 type:complete len:218 (-) Transcript_16495:371-1024(-)|eukprot:CAMPEP_0172451620 /NCGR_PEP_ID=MMETSP1065-20121228/9588_1 /TAXON_ID=265537 /ORGANISM="Amphiprora paludosa, Strain CCMP125" /LENGTH=217 /DNA_ID=CAMNT_0013203583 /DNA_START=79 /DNA_END=732 /DNA_ORIENTATION=+
MPSLSSRSTLQPLHLLLLWIGLTQFAVQAWTPAPLSRSIRQFQLASTTSTSASVPAVSNNDDDDEEEEEYEYLEYEALTEAEFVGSEWVVGTCWDNNPNKVDETWVRLVVDPESGKNLCFWGDNSEGKWNLDVASQFLSFSKESLAGKQIWACTVEDYYFLQGTVRGWTYWSAAAVLAQWQAKRLGVDPDEAGTAPWFLPQEEENESTEGGDLSNQQ